MFLFQLTTCYFSTLAQPDKLMFVQKKATVCKSTLDPADAVVLSCAVVMPIPFYDILLYVILPTRDFTLPNSAGNSVWTQSRRARSLEY